MKRKKKKIRPMYLIVLALIVYVSAIMINQHKLMRNLESKKIELEADIEALKNDINELNDEIENSDSLEFVEKIAREELGMVKPREIIYVDKNKIKDSIFNVFKRDTN